MDCLANIGAALAERLRQKHQLSVRILPADVMPDALRRLDLHAKPVIFLNLNGFWENYFALIRHSVREGMTPASFLDAYISVDTVEEAVAVMKMAEDTPHLKHDRR